MTIQKIEKPIIAFHRYCEIDKLVKSRGEKIALNEYFACPMLERHEHRRCLKYDAFISWTKEEDEPIRCKECKDEFPNGVILIGITETKKVD